MTTLFNSLNIVRKHQLDHDSNKPLKIRYLPLYFGAFYSLKCQRQSIKKGPIGHSIKSLYLHDFLEL